MRSALGFILLGSTSGGSSKIPSFNIQPGGNDFGTPVIPEDFTPSRVVSSREVSVRVALVRVALVRVALVRSALVRSA